MSDSPLRSSSEALLLLQCAALGHPAVSMPCSLSLWFKPPAALGTAALQTICHSKPSRAHLSMLQVGHRLPPENMENPGGPECQPDRQHRDCLPGRELDAGEHLLGAA